MAWLLGYSMFVVWGQGPRALEAAGLSVEGRARGGWLVYGDTALASELGLRYRVLVPDVQAWVRSLKQGPYHTWEEVVDTMEWAASQFPQICRLDTLGFSVEGRPILAWLISDNPDQPEPEPRVRVMGNIHGDEVIGCEIPLRFGLWVLENYSSDPQVRALVDSLEIWVVPVMNPDGHVNDTRYNANGVDLNRDQGYFWGGEGGSPSPISQVESRAYYAHLVRTAPSLEFVYHSVAQYVNYPWDWTPVDPPDSQFIIQEAEAYANLAGLQITNGYDWYQVTGSVQDHSEGVAGVLAYTIETDQPSDEASVEQIAAENREALLVLLRHVLDSSLGGFVHGPGGEPLLARVDFLSPERVSCYTDSSGTFFKMLEAGTYQIAVWAPGFEPETLTVQAPGFVDVALQPAEINYSGFSVVYTEYPNFSWWEDPDIPSLTWRTLGLPDGRAFSLGEGGALVIDMGADSAIGPVPNSADLYVYEAGSDGDEGYSVYVSERWDGDWVSLGTAAGTDSFEVSGYYRYVRIVDDGSNASGPTAGFDLDAVVSGRTSLLAEEGGKRPKLEAWASAGAVFVRLGRGGKLRLRVYDPSGRLVLPLEKELSAGLHELRLNLKPGVYYALVEAGGRRLSLRFARGR